MPPPLNLSRRSPGDKQREAAPPKLTKRPQMEPQKLSRQINYLQLSLSVRPGKIPKLFLLSAFLRARPMRTRCCVAVCLDSVETLITPWMLG
jgi:hypothetical protein